MYAWYLGQESDNWFFKYLLSNSFRLTNLIRSVANFSDINVFLDF